MQMPRLSKSFLIVSLLILVLPYSSNANAGRKKDIVCGAILTTGAIVVVGALAWLQTIHAQNEGREQCEIIERFRNDQNYQQLQDGARQLYYRRLFHPSSTSVDSDHPEVWLEKAATRNKSWLSVVSIFNTRFAPIVQRLATALSYLRGVREFNQEREKYNIRWEKQQDRKEKRAMQREILNLKKKKMGLLRN